MATSYEYLNVLSAIKNAPHAIGLGEIKRLTWLSDGVLEETLGKLQGAGYIKKDIQANGYFTRKPKRDEIAAFLDDCETLNGIEFDDDQPMAPTAPAPVPAPVQATTHAPTPTLNVESRFVLILAALREAPHAVSFESLASRFRWPNLREDLMELVEKGIIKADTNTGAYFTRKPKRDLVDAFLEGEASLDGLLGISDPTEEGVDEPTERQPGGELAEEPMITDLPESYINMLATLRDLANIVLASYGR